MWSSAGCISISWLFKTLFVPVFYSPLSFFFLGTSLQKYFLEITKPYSVHKISYLSANSFYIVENVNLQLTG